MDNECHETGSVQSLTSDNRANIIVSRGEACGSCAARGTCKTLGGGMDKAVLFTLENSIGAQKGDKVQITMSESSVLTASIVLYLVPAVMLIAGSLVAWNIAKIKNYDSDATVLSGALTGLLIGFFFTWLIGKILTSHNAIIPTMTAIVFRKDNSQNISDNNR